MHRDPVKQVEKKRKTDPTQPAGAYPDKANRGFWHTDVLFRSFVENSHSGILIIDNNYRILYANGVAVDIIGYPREEFIGSDFRKFIDEKNRDLVSRRYTERQKGENVPNRYEFQIVRKTGEKRDMEVSSTVVETKDGDLFTMAQLLDITERKRATERLIESEKKYRDVFQNVKDFIFIHDLDGNIVESNFQHIQKGGYSTKDILNSNIRDLMPDRFRNEFDGYLKRIQENGHDQGLMVLETKHGEEMVIEYNNSLVFGPNGPYAAKGIVRDITEEIKAKKALKNSEEKYRSIIENIQDCYIEVDLEGNITFLNDLCCIYSGYSREELLGTNNRDFMNEKNVEILKHACKKVYETGIPEQGIVYEMITKSGRVIHMETFVALVKDALGQPVGFRGISRDITDRIKAQEELRHARDQLEARVQERTMELAKINEELEAKTISLEEVNTALRILLKRREEDKKELEKKMLHNLQDLVLPHLEKLNTGDINDKQRAYLEIIKSNLNDIVSPFVHDLSSKYLNLTPTEIQVANFIKHGKTTKEIAELLNLSTKTIESHRKNIRRKIGIQNKKANLRTHLLSIG